MILFLLLLIKNGEILLDLVILPALNLMIGNTVTMVTTIQFQFLTLSQIKPKSL